MKWINNLNIFASVYENTIPPPRRMGLDQPNNDRLGHWHERLWAHRLTEINIAEQSDNSDCDFYFLAS